MELLLHKPPTLISPSRIKEYRQCPKKAEFIYDRELVPTEEPKGYFNKGNYFHELSHVYYELIKAGATPGSLYAIEFMKKRIQSDLEQYLKQTKDKASLLNVFGIISKRLLRFVAEQSPIIDKGISVKGVEYELIYPFTDNKALRGFADLIYRDGAGTLRIRDHKTGEKAWTKLDARYSTQLIFYACIIYKLTGEVPLAEISYINTKEYKSKEPTKEEMFTFSTVVFTAQELNLFFEKICIEIDEMLTSSPSPYYSASNCTYCAYREPCYAERKGVDSSHLIKFNFRKRESVRKHASFTDQHSQGDVFD